MNIDEIRAEISNAFTGWHDDTVEWIQRHSCPDYQPDSQKDALREAARMLVNWAFEAGKATGYQNGWDFGYTEGVEASENYKRGFEAGKAADSDCPNCEKVGYDMGYEAAAKDPKAWWVPDKNGNDVHIGDYYYDGDGKLEMVELLGNGYVDCDFPEYQSSAISKAIEDTWERLRNDIARLAALEDQFHPYARADVLIDRAKKLAEVD